MWPNSQFPVDLITFTEEIPDGKLHFLCGTNYTFPWISPFYSSWKSYKGPKILIKEAVQRCSVKKVPEACNFIKKETLAQVFSCEFCTFLQRTPLVAASIISHQLKEVWVNWKVSQFGIAIFSFLRKYMRRNQKCVTA